MFAGPASKQELLADPDAADETGHDPEVGGVRAGGNGAGGGRIGALQTLILHPARRPRRPGFRGKNDLLPEVIGR